MRDVPGRRSIAPRSGSRPGTTADRPPVFFVFILTGEARKLGLTKQTQLRLANLLLYNELDIIPVGLLRAIKANLPANRPRFTGEHP